jgi:hypothetical protein
MKSLSFGEDQRYYNGENVPQSQKIDLFEEFANPDTACRVPTHYTNLKIAKNSRQKQTDSLGGLQKFANGTI